MYIATVTQKGQITIPKALRKQFGVNAYGTVQLSAGKDHIKISPTADIVDLAGTFKPRKNKSKSVLQAREAMEKNYERV